jgi:peroxiredoxin
MRTRDRIYMLVTGTLLVSWVLVWGRSLIAGPEELGIKVAEFRLADTAGRIHSLSQYSGQIVVLSFWAFKCPVSLSYDERLGALQKKYKSAGVVVLAVDSNANETAAEIRANAANLKLPFPVLLDEDGSLAERLKATQTPSLFIIDGRGILRYRGSLDNNKKPGEGGRAAYAEMGLEDILANRPLSEPETRTIGCPIRRRAN